MKLTVLFFASLREQLSTGQLNMDSATAFPTVESLLDTLRSKGEVWQQALSGGRLIAAVNQIVVEPSHKLQDGDEVAFYPPVTGG